MSTRADSPPSALTGSLLARVDSALGWLVALPAAVLVAVEVVLLFTGVIARYVFHKPLIIADELSSVLFLWMAMMGAARGRERGECDGTDQGPTKGSIHCRSPRWCSRDQVGLGTDACRVG